MPRTAPISRARAASRAVSSSPATARSLPRWRRKGSCASGDKTRAIVSDNARKAVPACPVTGPVLVGRSPQTDHLIFDPDADIVGAAKAAMFAADQVAPLRDVS